MARATFRQRDLTRAIKSAAASGVPNARVRIAEDGEIVVEFGQLAKKKIEKSASQEQAEAADRLERLSEQWGG